MSAIVNNELARFFAVHAFLRTSRVPCHMPAGIVDLHWHRLLDDPLAYAPLSIRAAGCVIAHVPSQGHGSIEWVPTYHALFGPLPACWFALSPDGSVCRNTYDHYLRTGAFIASWNCDPYDPPEDDQAVIPRPTKSRRPSLPSSTDTPSTA